MHPLCCPGEKIVKIIWKLPCTKHNLSKNVSWERRFCFHENKSWSKHPLTCGAHSCSCDGMASARSPCPQLISIHQTRIEASSLPPQWPFFPLSFALSFSPPFRSSIRVLEHRLCLSIWEGDQGLVWESFCNTLNAFQRIYIQQGRSFREGM